MPVICLISQYESSTLLSEEKLTEKLKELLSKLIDHELLEAFGWPDQPVEEVNNNRHFVMYTYIKKNNEIL